MYFLFVFAEYPDQVLKILDLGRRLDLGEILSVLLKLLQLVGVDFVPNLFDVLRSLGIFMVVFETLILRLRVHYHSVCQLSLQHHVTQLFKLLLEVHCLFL